MWSKYGSIFENDTDQYYSYLPSVFIYKSADLSYPEANRYWANKTENGALVPKTSIGMAYTYLPFFIPAYAIQSISSGDNTGYEPIYESAAEIWGVILAIVCVWLLYSLAYMYVGKVVALATAYLLFFGTNVLFYSMGLGLMSHLPLLVLFTLVIYCTEKLKHQPNFKVLLALCFSISFIAIIRPSDVLVALYPLWALISNAEFRKNIILFITKPWCILGLLLAFALPIVPQLLYWKISADQWVVYSYGDEGFFFNNSKWIDFLIGYRKGWFVYTPLAAIALLSALAFRKKKFISLTAILVIVSLAVYVYASWWAWWYGGSFGSRTMIQYLAFFVLPLAALLNFLKEKSWAIKLSALGILGFVVVLNLLQTNQYKIGEMHWDGMTKEAYWSIFMGRDKPYDYYGTIKVPDYEGRKYTGEEYGNMLHGKVENRTFNDLYGPTISVNSDHKLSYIQVKVYTVGSIENAVVVLSATNANGEDVFYTKKDISNSPQSGEVKFTLIDVYTNESQTKNTEIKAYIYNPTSENLNLQSMELSAY